MSSLMSHHTKHVTDGEGGAEKHLLDTNVIHMNSLAAVLISTYQLVVTKAL